MAYRFCNYWLGSPTYSQCCEIYSSPGERQYLHHHKHLKQYVEQNGLVLLSITAVSVADSKNGEYLAKFVSLFQLFTGNFFIVVDVCYCFRNLDRKSNWFF